MAGCRRLAAHRYFGFLIWLPLEQLLLQRVCLQSHRSGLMFCSCGLGLQGKQFRNALSKVLLGFRPWGNGHHLMRGLAFVALVICLSCRWLEEVTAERLQLHQGSLLPFSLLQSPGREAAKSIASRFQH